MQVRAVMIGTHNMCEETLFENELFRRRMKEAGVALIWITPGWDQQWKADSGSPEAYWQMLDDLAETSGYGELKFTPIIPIGHSAMATYPWNFAAWHPECTLAVVSYHGDAPRTNLTGYGRENLEWGRTRNIDGIPGLMVEGEYEWWEARVNPALAFRMMYPESCISFLCDAGRGHFDVSDRTAEYIALFVKKALQARLPDTVAQDRPVALRKVRPQDGWLAERWPPAQPHRAKPAPYAKYKGDVHDAFWYFDREMAELTEDFYRQEHDLLPQYVSFMQEGQLVPYNPQSHVTLSARFLPEADGVTFHLKAVYTDSLRASLADKHSIAVPRIERICGPVKRVNDTTFVLDFYRMGTTNKKRTSSITLVASAGGDRQYKECVQELSFNIPYPLTEGRRQCILFPGIEDVKAETESVTLDATSDCGLPVYYYVKEGPATIKGDKLIFTKIPPRSKYPLRVTVVAWQYGIIGNVQTAEPVERTFFIEK